MVERNLPVGAVCHGIEVLATADVLRGKKVTTVAKCRFDAEVCGGIYVDQEVVVSGSIVTSRTWHDNHAWMREYLRMLNR
jgi:protease I